MLSLRQTGDLDSQGNVRIWACTPVVHFTCWPRRQSLYAQKLVLICHHTATYWCGVKCSHL